MTNNTFSITRRKALLAGASVAAAMTIPNTFKRRSECCIHLQPN